MGIKAKLTKPDHMSPIEMELDGKKFELTKKAAVELKNKLELALEELTVYEADKA